MKVVFLYTALVISHLEYANQVWCPYTMRDIETVENVQRLAAKLAPKLKRDVIQGKTKEASLTNTGVQNSKEYDLTYKILREIYDQSTYKDLFVMQEDASTQGHKKIFKQRSRLDKRKYAFHDQVILPSYMINGETVISVEISLHKIWRIQDTRFKVHISTNQHNQSTE